MSTTIKSRSEVDLHALIGPLTKEPEPKTLEECLWEAGGFPFVARAVRVVERKPDDTVNPVAVGAEVRLTKIREDGLFRAPDLDPDRARSMALDPSVRRWFLVGHKT